jgi:hypothetical protein
MRMMRALLLATVVLAACSRREAKVGPDLVDAAPADAAVVEAPLDRFMVGARIVDVPARVVAHELMKKPPTFAQLDRETAFIVHEGVVRAFDSKTAIERWHVTPPRCRLFAMTEHEVHCAGDDDIYAIAKSDGTVRKIASGRPISQLLGVGRHLIVLRAGSELESYREGDTTAIATTKAVLHAYRGLIKYGDGFCGAAASVKGGVFAGCWSSTLTPKWTRAITIARPGDPTLTSYDVIRLANGFLVAGSFPFRTPDRAVVVRLSDGDEVARVDKDVAAVTARNEREIDGLISLKKGLRYLEPNGTVRWSAPKLRVDDSADALLDGERVFVATYPMISSGASLFALDRKTGALLFTHSPPMPSIAHSAYMNDVELAIVANTLVMRGHEAGVEYASLLDRTTGTAYLNSVLPLWGP